MLANRIAVAIGADGPWPFERFMETALYDPDGGFFAADRLRSDRTGDFLTSPEISPYFGSAIARFVATEMERSGPVDLVEVGAGSGSLLRPLLDALDRPPRRVVAVDLSPAARRRLSELVPEAKVVRNLDDVVDLTKAVVVANELLDNLPAAVAVRRGDGWRERWVDVDGDSLVLVEVEARSDVVAWADEHGGPVDEGSIVEVQLAATALLSGLFDRIESGAVLTIDYGDTAEGLAPRRGEGTLRTYKAHHLGPDPLLEPGATDITMDVNFSALVAVAEAAGWDVTLDRQDAWLEAHGLRTTLTELRQRALAEARAGEVMAQLATKSEITGVETVLHPRGLGDFRVLTARSPTGATRGSR